MFLYLKVSKDLHKSLNTTSNLVRTNAAEYSASALLQDVYGVYNNIYKLISKSESLLDESTELKNTFEKGKSELFKLIEKANNSNQTIVANILELIFGSINRIGDLMHSNELHKEKIGSLKTDCAAYTKQIDVLLERLKAGLTPTEQKVLNLHLDKYKLEHNNLVRQMSSEQHNKLLEQQKKFDEELFIKDQQSQQDKSILLTQIENKSKVLEDKLKEINQLNIKVEKNNVEFKAELRHLHDNTVKLAGALGVLAFTGAGAILGSIFIPVPGVGAAIGSIVGAGLGGAAYVATAGNCVIQ